MSSPVRTTINLKPKAAVALESTQARMQENATDAVNAAVVLRDFVTERMAEGAVLVLREPGKGETRVVIL
jgi:hypothetical protein